MEYETGGPWNRMCGELPAQVASLVEAVERDPTLVGDVVDLRDSLAVELSELAADADVSVLVGHIAWRIEHLGPGPVDHRERWGVEARLQYLAGVGLSVDAPGVREPDPADIQKALELIRSLFLLERTIIVASADATEDPYLHRARRALRLEHLEDRFQSFSRHQRRIAEVMFDEIGELFFDTYGWRPSDLIDVGDAARRMKVDRVNQMLDAGRTLQSKAGEDEAAGIAQVVRYQHAAGPGIVAFTVSELAAESSVPNERIAALLESLAAPWATSEQVRVPSDENLFRFLGVMRTAKESCWLIPIPNLWLQECLTAVAWFAAQQPRLSSRWLKARDGVTGTLVASELAALFTAERVFTEVDLLDGPAAGESDIIVYLDDDAMIIECKAHTLTPSGRRGAPGRVTTKANELLGTGYKQVERCKDHFRTAGARFRPAHSTARALPVSPASLLPSLVVSFERIDPLIVNSAQRSFDSPPTLAVSLADFMSMCEVLASPSALIHYVLERNRLVNVKNLITASESDFLGVYIESQSFMQIHDNLEEASAEDIVALDGFADLVNDALAQPEDGAPVLTMPPPPVVRALSAVLTGPSQGWVAVTAAVHNAPTTVWKRYRSVARRLARTTEGSAGKTRLIAIEGTDVVVEPIRGSVASLAANAESCTIRVPVR